MGKVNNQHVYLRRFRLLDGTALDLAPGYVEARPGSPATRFLTEGSVIWNSVSDSVVYIPQNPWELRRFSAAGQVVEVGRPAEADFRNADMQAMSSAMMRRPWIASDTIYNAICLADGRIVLQVLKGRDVIRPPQWNGISGFLSVLDSTLARPLGRVYLSPGPGLLVGADSSGQLYFADLGPVGESSVTLARLTAR
jgi:hypothetical protein